MITIQACIPASIAAAGRVEVLLTPEILAAYLSCEVSGAKLLLDQGVDRRQLVQLNEMEYRLNE